MRSFLRFTTSLAIASLCGTALAAEQTHLLERARTGLETGVYQFDVLTGKNGSRRIDIRCVDECRADAASYHEDTNFQPVYAMVPKDGSPRFLSLWTSGSALRIMVHEVGGGSPKKLLEAGSRIPPAVSLDAKGDEVFTLCDEDHGCTEYHWSGDRYTTRRIGDWKAP